MDPDLIAFAKQGAPGAPRPAIRPARFVWARNRNAAGVMPDPMPQLIYENVGVSHLEIVAEHKIDTAISGAASIDFLAKMYPAPEVSDA
jgi:hypothetical protein